MNNTYFSEMEENDRKTKAGQQKKRKNSDVISTRRPKRAAACTNFKEKSIRISHKSSNVETKKRQQIVEDEMDALKLTSPQGNELRPNRRLTNFILHDVDRVPHPLEMLEIKDIFLDGIILPLEKCCDDKEKEKGVRCKYFGRVENWNISGYEDGFPVIWISTEFADYDCVKPANTYKKFYDHFFEKAVASVAVYKKLSKSSGDMSLDVLLASVVRSMSGSKYLSNYAAIHEFVVFQGEFIYNQLIGLDETAKKQESRFAEIPVLAALRDERCKLMSLRIGGVEETSEDDLKYVKLKQDEEYRKSIQRPRKNSNSSASSNMYIKINEEEIANDYPLPSYYNKTQEEADELLLYEQTKYDDGRVLPCKRLHNWALYNSDSRLISLELLPMKTCTDMDVNIFGSGLVTDDDGSGYCPESESSSQDLDGLPIFLSQIKEWMIEYGSGFVVITIRTDVSWYRLGKPSKQYEPWCEPILKIARVVLSIFDLLCEQTRVAKLSFAAVIKKLSEFQKNDKAYISSDPSAVERYVIVHGQIFLQLFAEHHNRDFQRCPFITCLASKMEGRHHKRWIIKKKKKKTLMRKEPNHNPMAAMELVSKRKTMQATTTRLIRRIWGEFHSVYSPNDSLQQPIDEETTLEKEVDEIEEEEEDEAVTEPFEVHNSHATSLMESGDKWDGEIFGITSSGETLYRKAFIGGEMVAVGGAVMLEIDDNSDELSAIYFVEYMFESSDNRKFLHGRLLQRGSETVLRTAANERELFLTNECMTVQLEDIKGTVSFEIRSRQCGHQYRKENITADKLDHERAEERKAKGLPMEYYCRSLYSPERGGFFSLPISDIGQGSGFCGSCKLKEDKTEKSKTILNASKTSFLSNGIEYNTEDFVYVNPLHIYGLKKGARKFKSGLNIGLRAFVVCQLLEIIVQEKPRKADLSSFHVKVRRFYRPEDISTEKVYASDIQELYYSQDTNILSPEALEGKCEVRKKNHMPVRREYPISEHVFFCEYSYNSSSGSLNQLTTNIKLKLSTIKDKMLLAKIKGKGLESETDSRIVKPDEMRLATLDIFAGCGGLSQGLEQAGISITKWAIEYEKLAGEAFKLNNPESTVFVNNCNVILRAIMEKCGDQDDCISTKEAVELAAKLDDDQKRILPLPGQVDFICGGPPCQGFSGMNRYEKSYWSKVQCQMILAFLSFADYFRPRYFLLENVRNFVSHNEGQTFRLTLASLLEMGYQVRFGILEAGAYGVSQSRKRAFIWAAAPEEILPEWPEPMHVFGAPKLKISLTRGLHYGAVRSTASGAPFRAITVRDTIGDLPPVENGESKTNKEYQVNPVSWFQKVIRGNMSVLTDHICKAMNEINLIRCKNIPKRAGADWRDLPKKTVKLSNGKLDNLIPNCLPNTAERNNQWKGLFGRLNWEGNFPTSITDPQPMGKVGNCFHPDQDRIVSVRECARSQGFPDSFIFAGKIQHKHRQIGNAVPPPLAFALGRKLKEAVILKNSLQRHQS